VLTTRLTSRNLITATGYSALDLCNVASLADTATQRAQTWVGLSRLSPVHYGATHGDLSFAFGVLGTDGQRSTRYISRQLVSACPVTAFSACQWMLTMPMSSCSSQQEPIIATSDRSTRSVSELSALHSCCHYGRGIFDWVW